MAAGHVVAHGGPKVAGEVDDRAVLEVGGVSDPDRLDVRPEDTPIPDAGIVTDGDVAQNDGSRGNEGRGWQRGGVSQMGANGRIH